MASVVGVTKEASGKWHQHSWVRRWGGKSEGGGERGWQCQRVRVVGDGGNGEKGEGGGEMAADVEVEDVWGSLRKGGICHLAVAVVGSSPLQVAAADVGSDIVGGGGGFSYGGSMVAAAAPSVVVVLVVGGGDGAAMLELGKSKWWQQMAVRLWARPRRWWQCDDRDGWSRGNDRAHDGQRGDGSGRCGGDGRRCQWASLRLRGVAEGKARAAEAMEVSGKAEISKAGEVVTGDEGDETTEGTGAGETKVGVADKTAMAGTEVMMGKCGGEAAFVTIVGEAGMVTGGATEGVRDEAKAEVGRTEDAGVMVMGLDVVVEVSEAETVAREAGAGAGAIGVGRAVTEVDETEVMAMMTVGDGGMVVEAGDVRTVTVMEDKAGNGERETEDQNWLKKFYVNFLIDAFSYMYHCQLYRMASITKDALSTACDRIVPNPSFKETVDNFKEKFISRKDKYGRSQPYHRPPTPQAPSLVETSSKVSTFEQVLDPYTAIHEFLPMLTTLALH
ncbi:hypothetical protein F5148DRAFT_1368116 [Russula earlei]|uniref:Uncharacterized protein n=1 Tax=Russula earlei TaxID=71964 RepID=A0ACC0U8W6_9AGAM|nr:hypothetical protein F5148DRAFT_1368116 [Russula earlei]